MEKLSLQVATAAFFWLEFLWNMTEKRIDNLTENS